MNHTLLLLLALCLLIVGAMAQPADRKSARASLVEAERAFSRASAATGTRAAFLAYLAEDAILFRPHPVAGRKWLQDNPASPGRLTWEPAGGEVARAGDLGYTYGAAALKDPARRQPTQHSAYLRIWQKLDGQWKAVLDIASPSPSPS
jgi:ketosteroid isomerase-like protein